MSNEIEYAIDEEKIYVQQRLYLTILLTIASFLGSGLLSGILAEKMLLAGFVLLIADLVGILHYVWIVVRPETAIVLRRISMLLTDIGMLSYLLYAYERWGVFLLPLYLLMLFRSVVNLGWRCFYIGAAAVFGAWAGVYYLSPYWHRQESLLLAFAMTAVVLPVAMRNYLYLPYEEEAYEDEEADYEETEQSDRLTGIANRDLYKRTLQHKVGEKRPFSLLFVDIDKLDDVNTKLGRQAGDEIIREVAKRLQEVVGNDAFLARLGADEFAIVTDASGKELEAFVSKIERIAGGRHRIGGKIVPIELNIGISRYPDDANMPMMLGKYADIALQAAIEDPKRSYCFYHLLSREKRDELLNR